MKYSSEDSLIPSLGNGSLFSRDWEIDAGLDALDSCILSTLPRTKNYLICRTIESFNNVHEDVRRFFRAVCCCKISCTQRMR